MFSIPEVIMVLLMELEGTSWLGGTVQNRGVMMGGGGKQACIVMFPTEFAPTNCYYFRLSLLLNLLGVIVKIDLILFQTSLLNDNNPKCDTRTM